MQPKIVERAAFHVVGMRRRIAAGELEGMHELWGEFSKREGEIADKDPCVCYGIVIGDSRPGDPGFLYMACAETKSPDRVPPDIEVYDERFKLHAADSECDMLVPVK
jgi:predicted transcriptional regulator YdeE